MYACHGCRTVPAQLLQTDSSVVIGRATPETIVGEPYTEVQRSAAAQSFVAAKTGLVVAMDVALRVAHGNVYGRAALCLWITKISPQGTPGSINVDDGNKCFDAVAGSDGFVTVTFDRAVYIEEGVTYFLTLRHGAWYSQTTRFAALPNTVPMKMAGGMEVGKSQTASAIWLGAYGNPYWPYTSGMGSGEALTQDEGTDVWTTHRDLDLAFRYSYCSTGFPYVLNLTSGFDFEITHKIAPMGCCHARSSPLPGALITITGANFFPSEDLLCAWHLPNGTIGPKTNARPLTTDFTKAVCASPANFEPYSDYTCSAESCLGVFLSITNDGYNFPSVTGNPRTTLGDQTRKIMISDLYVSETGHDYIGDGTLWRPYATLQRAIRAANQVDRITILNAEILTGAMNRGLKHLGKDILIRSYPGTVATIDCENQDVMAIADSEQDAWNLVYPAGSVSEGTHGQITVTGEILVQRCRTLSETFSYTPNPSLDMGRDENAWYSRYRD